MAGDKNVHEVLILPSFINTNRSKTRIISKYQSEEGDGTLEQDSFLRLMCLR